MHMRPRQSVWPAAILLAAGACLLGSLLMCALPLALGRSGPQAAAQTINARLCVEEQYADSVTVSVGAYYRAGSGPLPGPIVSSYRLCVFIPWATNLPAQAAVVLPPWRAPR
jgi:hypothetical protein